MASVVIYFEFSGKKPHRQMGVDRVVTSGSLACVMVSTLAWNASEVGSTSALGTMFPIFTTATTKS